VNRLERWHRVLLYGACIVLLLTGVACEIAGAGELRSWLMRLHGAAAMAVLVALGALLTAHVPAGWTSGSNRLSGLALLGTSAWLAITGLLLYYAGGEWLRAFASQTHFWVGIALSLAIGVHIRRPADANEARGTGA
jgi:hypothetical protein